MAIFTKVFNLIDCINFSKLDDGVFEVKKSDFYYILSTYITSEDIEKKSAEAHRKYIDFQYIIYGEEKIGYADYSNLKSVKKEYDQEKDVEFFNEIESEVYLILGKGMYAIFFPEDIHRPGIKNIELRGVRKLIFKIPIKNI